MSALLVTNVYIKNITLSLIVLAILISGLIWVGTTFDNQTTQQDSDVVTTVFPIYDITRNIAGDTLEINLLLSPGASPHTFEPSPKILRTIQQSSVMYGVGHGLDDWAFDIAEGTTPVVVLDQNIETEYKHTAEENDDEHNEVQDSEEHAHDQEPHELDGHEKEDEHNHGPTNPHYWLSIENGKQIAKNVTSDLSQRFPEHSTIFENNLEDYLHELDLAEAEIQEIMKHDIENHNLITLHDAWYHFAQAYDLNIIGTFEPSAGREPSPQYIIRLTEALHEAGTDTIYSEPQIPTSALDSFVVDNDLEIAELDPLGGVDGRDSYINMMLYNAKTLSQHQ